uniref:Uncharacterized protein n=1 Tax=Arundo donax TaxID=35708 RepID=A0A0A8ZUA2_ARUDO
MPCPMCSRLPASLDRFLDLQFSTQESLGTRSSTRLFPGAHKADHTDNRKAYP